MRHRSKTQLYGQWLKLVKKTNPKTGRRHYTVIADTYHYVDDHGRISGANLTQIRDELRAHFDPAGNRGIRGSLSWKFSNKEDAEKLIMLALLKWGERYVA